MARSSDKHCTMYQSLHCKKLRIYHDGNPMVFPFDVSRYWPKSLFNSWLAQSFTVHASETQKGVSGSDKMPNSSASSQTQHKAEESGGSSVAPHVYSPELEMLARAYIEQETGKERVRMIFKKDHMGKSSQEMDCMQVALAQTFVISFFMKYVPAFRLAKQEFIREHHGTVFRTRLEAVRRMQDHVSLRAGMEGGKFAIKMTSFGASFVLISQMIASYRNRTSILEYAAAAGITGGLAKIQLGIKGFIAGSLVGTVLGSLAGSLAYAIFKAYNATQEERHVHAIMALLDVEKSVEGSTEFKKRMEQIKNNKVQQSLTAS